MVHPWKLKYMFKSTLEIIAFCKFYGYILNFSKLKSLILDFLHPAVCYIRRHWAQLLCSWWDCSGRQPAVPSGGLRALEMGIWASFLKGRGIKIIYCSHVFLTTSSNVLQTLDSHSKLVEWVKFTFSLISVTLGPLWPFSPFTTDLKLSKDLLSFSSNMSLVPSQITTTVTISIMVTYCLQTFMGPASMHSLDASSAQGLKYPYSRCQPGCVLIQRLNEGRIYF